MSAGARRWQRRARPALGTLVEVGADEDDAAPDAVGAAFAAVEQVQACLSRFDPHSDIARFHALPRGAALRVRASTRHVLAAARELQTASAGVFDISQGSAPGGWELRGDELCKLDAGVQLDLGGIAKGHAVDLAVAALRDHGCSAGWVNAGGDLRAFGDIDAPVHLRDEGHGGVRAFALLRDGAFATSVFGDGARSRLSAPGRRVPRAAQVSVAAPLCLWADALTKVIAASGDAAHPLLAAYAATAWVHRGGA